MQLEEVGYYFSKLISFFSHLADLIEYNMKWEGKTISLLLHSTSEKQVKNIPQVVEVLGVNTKALKYIFLSFHFSSITMCLSYHKKNKLKKKQNTTET